MEVLRAEKLMRGVIRGLLLSHILIGSRPDDRIYDKPYQEAKKRIFEKTQRAILILNEQSRLPDSRADK